MPKKQTKKPKYPKELLVARILAGHDERGNEEYLLLGVASVEHVQGTVAIYKFDRLAKVKRTVTVE